MEKGESSLTVDFQDLDRFNPELADRLLNDPDAVLDSAREVLSSLLDEPRKIEVRFKNLPESKTVRIRNLRSSHIGKFVCIEGVVKRASEVKPEVEVAIFECPDCGEKISVPQSERTLKPPDSCVCGKKSGFVLTDKKLFDARWIVLEEPFELSVGEKPGQVTVYLKKDLTTPEMQRKTDPGNKLKINGVVREIKKTVRGRLKTQMDFFIEANYVEPTEIEWEEIEISKEDEKKIKELASDPDVYKKLVRSIAPSIFGLDTIKEAILLQLVGGVPHELPDGTRIRGDIHILLVGDPAVAKSQLLKLVANIIPRGRYVSGKGVSGAGLTATVFRDEEFMGGWVLEAGAMVLCHKGVIAIDEFDKMSKDDQIAMHEALEQQTISIAKASIVATLPAQVSVLAGSNPKFSRFDPFKPIAEQIDIPDTLLSRFDLKFAIRDVPDRKRDEELASYVLETRLDPKKVEPEIPPEFLRKFIAYVRKHCHPKMTREASEKIKEFYVKMRNMYAGEDTVAITLRQNEALVRLAEASAKIRLSDRVEAQDAERAIKLMKYSLEQLGYDYETGRIDIDKLEGGTPSSQRSKIRKLMDIIERLEREMGKDIPKEDIVAAAESEGLKNIDELLSKLKSEGMIYEPRLNVIRKT
ncbi:MAG: minichromosome maintenance protein MCM [Candidatus Micrarchaeota archaeon]|nr:minichromosome maintenance protein MCM [Candidatus Micrarchaeota archaeon]